MVYNIDDFVIDFDSNDQLSNDVSLKSYVRHYRLVVVH